MDQQLLPDQTSHNHPVSRPSALQQLRDLRLGKDRTAKEAARASSFEVWAKRLLVVAILLWAVSPLLGFTTSLSILVILGFALLFIGLFLPIFGVLGIGLLSTLDPLTRVFLLTGGILRWNTLNYWLILVIILMILLFLRLKDPHTRLLQLFILLLTIEVLVSAGRSEGIQDILHITATFGIVLYFVRALPEKPNLYWLGIFNGTIAAVGGGMFYLLKDQLPYIDPNAWSFFPLTGLISICVGFHFAKSQPRKQGLLFILAFVNFIWIFLSGSRGGMLSGLFCLLFLILTVRSFSRVTIFIAIVVVLGVWLTDQFAGQQVYALNRVERFLNPDLTLRQRTSGRSTLMEAGWKIFLEHPLGIGTGGFRSEVTAQNLAFGRSSPAHSAWIKSLAENGFIGFLLLFAYVISFVVVGWQKRSQGLFMIGLLTTVVFTSSFVSTQYQGKAVWFLGSITTVLLHQDELLRILDDIKKNRFLRQFQSPKIRKARRIG